MWHKHTHLHICSHQYAILFNKILNHVVCFIFFVRCLDHFKAGEGVNSTLSTSIHEWLIICLRSSFVHLWVSFVVKQNSCKSSCQCNESLNSRRINQMKMRFLGTTVTNNKGSVICDTDPNWLLIVNSPDFPAILVTRNGGWEFVKRYKLQIES